MHKDKQIPQHIVHTQSVAKKAVESVTNTIDNHYFSERKLKSKKMQSLPGTTHEQMKVVKVYLNKAVKNAARESARAYSRERTAAILSQAVADAEKAKMLSNAAVAKVGVGVGLLLRPFRSAGASLVAGFQSGLNPAPAVEVSEQA